MKRFVSSVLVILLLLALLPVGLGASASVVSPYIKLWIANETETGWRFTD